MKKLECFIIITIIFLLFSGCNRDTGYQDGTPDYVLTCYCGYNTTIHTEGKKIVDDRDIVIVPCGETVKTFYDKLSGLAEIEIFDSHGNLPDENTALATGFLVNGKDKNYYVVVLGDVDGDGKITAVDSALAEEYSRGEAKASALPYVIASDVDLSMTVDSTDVDLISYATKSENMALGWYYEAKSIVKLNPVRYEEYSKLLK